MPVLQPKEMNDFDKSVAIFDFPDDSSLSQQEEATAPRRNLSRTKRKRTEPTTTKTSKSEKENKKSTSSQERRSMGRNVTSLYAQYVDMKVLMKKREHFIH